MNREGKVISIINWKGGVGKTTLTHHLATGLQHLSLDDLEKLLGERRFPKVLLVDADAQCNLSISCLTANQFENQVFRNEEPLPTMRDLVDEFIERKSMTSEIDDFILKKIVRSDDQKVYTNIDMILSHPDLIYTDMNIAVYSKQPSFKDNLLGSDIYKFQILDEILTPLKQTYDFIFIDCPPNLHYLTQNALYVSDDYLIPTIPDTLSSYGIISISHKVNELNNLFAQRVRDYVNTHLIGIVANNIREHRNQPKESQAQVLNKLKAAFHSGEVFENYLTYGDGISKASASGYPVFALENTNQTTQKQCLQAQNIVKEFLQRYRKGVSPSV
ncbi:ParA family protein [Texcoconibacillus texcoconensis]|uniref:Chromosome partitioning protein n=1 Tax=Texcoconibacillus texcoconensis TaxID=1095777 RepID=A0A840QM79_9BACI|nr:AAA family ATPase [Texcoconibacillus texcoconensis]MBB5172485.1 chromosome partitioning protein [Texcoconibacillus texcoconensis]